MRKLRTLFILLTLLFAFVFAGFNSNAQELVTNGGFETGDFTGWTQEMLTPADGWFVYTGTLSPINSIPILAPPVGNFAAVADQGAPDSNILYQDIQIPAGETVTCSAIVYYENVGGEGGSVFIIGDGLTLNEDNQQYRVDIMDPNAPSFDTGAGVLLNLFQTLPGDPNSLGYTTLNFDLSPFAGSTVRIRAAVVVTENPLNGSIDAVSCVVKTGIPTLSEWGLIAMAGILGIVGFMVMRRRKVTA